MQGLAEIRSCFARFSNLLLGPFILIFSLLPAGGQSQTPTAASAPLLRFDGAYKGHLYYFRFFEDGLVVQWPADSDEAAGTILTRNLPGKGKYTVQGEAIEIWFEMEKAQLKGSIENNQVRIKEEHRGPWSAHGEQMLLFVPLDFAAAQRKHDEELAAKFLRARDEVRVQVGTATMDKQCGSVQFTPLAEPVRLRPLSTELAYQVSFLPQGQDASIRIRGICGARPVTTRKCNKWTIQMGTPANTGWTTIMKCGDGKPLQPGRYKAQLFFESEPKPAKEVPFQVP